MSCKTCGADGWGFHSCFDVLLEGLPGLKAHKLQKVYLDQVRLTASKDEKIRELETEIMVLNEIQYHFWKKAQK